MKKVCEYLRGHAIEIILIRKMELGTKEQQESYENANIGYFC